MHVALNGTWLCHGAMLQRFPDGKATVCYNNSGNQTWATSATNGGVQWENHL